MEKYDELKKNVNILLVDDDTDYIHVTGFFLKNKGYNVDIATNGEEAIKKVKDGNIHIILLDYYMPGMTGEDVINKVREFNQEIIIIMQTGFSGQQPPAETLQRLNIQNYHDKSDGVEKLLLQVMSAVRIFNQQNEIMLSKYRINAIGRLIKGIAEDLKSPLMSISAGIEASNTLIETAQNDMDRDTILNLKKFYENNKSYLEKIDKILSTIILQTESEQEDEYLTEKEFIERIELILANEIKKSGINLEKDVMLKENSLIQGRVSDVVFIACEIINSAIAIMDRGEKLIISLKENTENWCIHIIGDKIKDITASKMYMIKNIISTLDGVSLGSEENEYIVAIKK